MVLCLFAVVVVLLLNIRSLKIHRSPGSGGRPSSTMSLLDSNDGIVIGGGSNPNIINSNNNSNSSSTIARLQGIRAEGGGANLISPIRERLSNEAGGRGHLGSCDEIINKG